MKAGRLRWALASALWSATSVWAALPFRPETEAGETSASWTAGVVIAVVLLLAAGLAVARKKGWRRSGGRSPDGQRPARVRMVVPLGGGARLVEVERRGQVLLLGVTATQITLLESTPDSPTEGP